MTLATLSPTLLTSTHTTNSTSKTSASIISALSDQTIYQSRPRIADIHSPFYGLPLEIIQHISTFLPFHDLVNVYKSLPKLHRPLFQQQLDHSIALMILTLDFKQNHDKPIHPLSRTDTPYTILQTSWRATNFDPEEMRVTFQLEDKLGVEVEEKRRILSCSSSFFSQQNENRNTNHGSNAAIPGATASVVEANNYGSIDQNIESTIWKARSRLIATRRRLPLEFTMTPTNTDDFPDNNFFHCRRSSSSPIIDSATISFKAHRNVQAHWIALQGSENLSSGRSQCSSVKLSSLLSSTPSSASPSKSFLESQRALCASEKMAAFQQNRILLKVLRKNQGLQEPNHIQFMPTNVSLDVREIGMKRVKAAVGRRRMPKSSTTKVKMMDTSTSILPAFLLPDSDTSPTLEVPTIKSSNTGRRHSWHMLGDLSRFAPSSFSSSTTGLETTSSSSTDTPPHSPSDADEPQSPSGLSTVLKQLLKHRPSWSGPSSPTSQRLPSSNDEDTNKHLAARDSNNLQKSGSADWKTMFTAMASSVPFFRNQDKSSDRKDDQGRGGRDIIVKSFNCDFEKSRHPLDQEHSQEDEEKVENEKELFELLYDVRHNYVASNLIEGERVIRPLVFSCTLDFFQQQL